jgi:serine protease
MIHAPEAWAMTQGAGVTVAIIDTGVTHSGKVVEDIQGVEFVKPYNFVSDNTNANDDHGHGTHVACTVAEQTNNGIGAVGIAPKVKIMPLKVLSKFGSGSIADISAAIMYAADNGAKVINMSLGGPFANSVLENAVNYAHKKGVIVVCAAGNSGPKENSVGYPAGYKNSVSVSSVDSTGELAWYSSWGKKVDISAPGGDTRSDKNGDGKVDGILQNTIVTSDPNNMARYELFQGTSMASPHVAGVAALIFSVMDKASPDEVLRVLQMASQKKNNTKKFGSGIVDAYAAVNIAKAFPYLKSLIDIGPYPSSFYPMSNLGLLIFSGDETGIDP